MTVTTMLAEITSRCGEGYENWSERAKAHFKEAIGELVRSGQYSQIDYHGLVVNSTYAVTGSISSVAIGTLLVTGSDLLKFIDVKVTIGATTTPVDIVTYQEKLATNNNSELISTGKKQWYWANNTIVFDAALANGNSIAVSAVLWKDAFLETGANIATDYFTSDFLQIAINEASARLYRELKA